jgi:hypothetical protein
MWYCPQQIEVQVLYLVEGCEMQGVIDSMTAVLVRMNEVGTQIPIELRLARIVFVYLPSIYNNKIDTPHTPNTPSPLR